MTLLQANALRIPLADESVPKMWYNSDCLNEQNTGAFCFLAAAFSQSEIVGKVPSTYGLLSSAVRLGNGSVRGGHCAMRDDKGKFIDGEHGINTRFKKGEHWRKQKPYWNREWLYNEYVIKQRSSSEIAADFNITDNGICFWLKKLEIPTRNTSEIRAIKYWGQRGKDNPMFGKRGEENPNWKGGNTPERQAFYSSIEWHKAIRIIWRRDKGICQRCGRQGKRRSVDGFHIHHIVSFSNTELRAKPSNLILLCNDCHKWIHSKENVNQDYLHLARERTGAAALAEWMNAKRNGKEATSLEDLPMFKVRE